MDLYLCVCDTCSWGEKKEKEKKKRNANSRAALILKTREQVHIPSYPHSQHDYLEMKRKMEAIY